MKSEQSLSFPSLTEPIDAEQALVDKMFADSVDRLGSMANAVAKAKKLITEYDGLRKVIEAQACKDREKSEEVTVHGDKFTVVFTPGTEKREVTNKAALFKALGQEQFVALATFTLKDVDDYCTPPERKEILTVDEHGGSRRHKVAKRR